MAIERDRIDDRRNAWVRLTAFEGAPEDVARALRLVTEHVLPSWRGLPGWQGLLGLASPDGRRGMMISFWSNESALSGSRSTYSGFHERAARAGIAVTDVAHFEIVFQEGVGSPYTDSTEVD